MARKPKKKKKTHTLTPERIDKILKKEEEKHMTQQRTQSAIVNQNHKLLVSSLLPVSPGAIIFLDGHYAAGPLSYLSKRPLLVVSVQTELRMNGVCCCSIGHRDNPGIQIHLMFDEQKCIGDIDTSVIYPWALHSFSVAQIASVVGYLRPDIFAEVKKCVAYHLGLSNEVPPYMKDLQYEVEYSNGARSFIGFNRYSPIEQVIPDEKVEEETGDIREEDVELPPVLEQFLGNTYTIPLAEEETMKKQTAVDEVFSNLDEQEICTILTRKLSLTKISSTYNLSMHQALSLRNMVEEEYVNYKTMKRIREKMHGDKNLAKFLSSIEKCVGAIYGTPARLNLSEKDTEHFKRGIIAAFGIIIDTTRFPAQSMAKAAAAIDVKPQ